MLTSVVHALALLGAATTVVGSVQQPFAFGSKASYDSGLFTPFEDMSLLSTEEFTTLGHPLFPNYDVRIKKSDFCDGTVRCVALYSGSGDQRN